MRRKLLIAATAGALTLSGAAVAVPALADEGRPGAPALSRVADVLDELVSDGTIDQAQADEVAEALSEAGLGHRDGGFGPFRGGWPGLGAAATALGMSEDELRAALRADGGTSLAEIAAERGVAVEDVVDALVAAAQERIAAAVEDGRWTQEEADERLADLEERIADRLDDAGPPASDRGPWGHRGGGAHDRPAPTPAD